jgi:hypothetical protein
MMHAYPRELAQFIRKHWVGMAREKPAPGAMCSLPTDTSLERLLSTIYQASLLREEERPVTFRVIVGPPSSFPEDGGPPDGLHRMMFVTPRPFTEHELRRLSPAAKYHRSLIAVESRPDGELQIWGILQSGPRWLEGVRGGTRNLPTLPEDKLVIRVTGPGRIGVASGSSNLGEIRGGLISGPARDIFESRWLAAMFERERGELATLHAAAKASAGESWGELDPSVTRFISQQMVKRVIETVREARHGGTVVLLPPERAEAALKDGIRIKYAFDDSEPRRRFRTLILAAMQALAASEGTGKIGWDEYRRSQSPVLSSLDEAVFEVSHMVAAMADVDGAVVMTKRFEIMGFGAEIVGTFADVGTVMRAIDLEGNEREEESVEGVGTRHRSAYRLASRERDALVVVISQDGTVRFIKWKDDAVTYWDHVTLGGTRE